jgi:acyl-CoA synthetase (AMP-forming)/AMP-acid ligase II
MYLTQALHRAVQQYPDAPALLGPAGTRSWRELVTRIAKFAGALRGLGVTTGDRVAILAPNCDEYVEFLYGVPWADGVLVPLNSRWSATEIAYALNDAEVGTLFVHEIFAPALDEIRAQSPALREVVVIGDIPGTVSYESLVDSAPAIEDSRRSGSELAGIWYTGGTSGVPKGVMLSHANLMTAAFGWLAAMPIEAGTTRLLHTAPMFHIADFATLITHTIAAGAHVTLPKFEPGAVLDAIRAYDVTEVLLVPSMLQMVLDHPGDKDVPSLRLISYAGSPAGEQTLRTAKEQFPTTGLRNAYGMTEFAPAITMLRPEDNHGDRLRSAGRALPHVELRIVDLDDNPVEPGDVGEIQLRGGSVMLGYWRKPKETAEALRDGWLRTGDCGRLDDEGYLYIVDRLKDMIISGGENVYSVEVENAITRHPAVAGCAVIGVPHDRLGESVHAVIVTRDGVRLSRDEVRDHVKQFIAGYKAPRSVDLVDALPTTAAGKIRKAELRARHAAEKAKEKTMLYADTPTVEVDTYIAAAPERVWSLVSDIHLMAEMSDEVLDVEWQDGVDSPAPGTKFVGRNFHKDFGEWKTTSIIVDCEAPKVFGWAVSDVDYPSSIWRFTLRPEGEGTVLSQWMQMGPARSGLSFAIDRMPDKEDRIVARRLREFREAIEANLAAFKKLSEGVEN